MSTQPTQPAAAPAPKPEKPANKYKATLALPNTPFAMKANLVVNEPASLKRWEAMDIYGKLREARKGAEPFVFHDGPPYANGNIHLGHLLNKVLKDLVVRSQNALGKDCAYTPGWDCHGLPIEHKVVQDLGSKALTMEPIEIRRLCHAYAEKQMAGQMTQMKRLLTLADYADPYFTMNPKFEQGTVEVFAQMVDKGLVFRQNKPVHWSIENRTALAEAELEYQDREDTSVYVWFEFAKESVPGVLEEFGLADLPAGAKPPALMIWTTTPWTLPANLAAAVHPSHVYALVELDGRLTVLAQERLAAVCKQRGLEVPAILGTTEGFNLKGLRYNHPFITACPADTGAQNASADNVYTVVCADYVTLEDGTGIVHTAPGHGTEDYQTGLREKLPVYCPVRENGTFDGTAPDWLQNQHVWKANPMVVERLKASGHLYHMSKFMHSYPHDWRGKTPVIFRATAQWFIGVDKAYGSETQGLRFAALRETEDAIRFIPAWGKNRLRGMLDSRPDWCVSRQRAWGLPIPAFFSVDGEALLTAASARAVAAAFGKHGSDAWYTQTPAQLLASWDAENDGQAPAWAKAPGALEKLRRGNDTFDVWFESGSSWNSVLREGWRAKQAYSAQKDSAFPADLYLEGSDQHRGWFQHSLLPAVALHGKSPFKTVLTHGFMVDKNGHKMSKSDGNTINVEDLMKTQGADVCRWWVASINPENDIKADISFFNLAGDEYRKVRNTIRFLLSVLDGFDATKRYEWDEKDNASIDAWILTHSVKLTDEVRAAYAEFRFRDISRAMFNFCNDTLSAVYLFAVKDRLYCDKSDSERRLRTQDAIYRVTESMIRLLAPICPHTADEAWLAFKGLPMDNLTESVHLMTLPKGNCCRGIAGAASPAWTRVMELRDGWTKAIEDQKKTLGAENPLDLGITVPADAKADLAQFDARDLADLVGVSRFAVGGEAIVVADLRGEPRCERSWKRDGTVKARSDGGMLSDRDAVAVGV